MDDKWVLRARRVVLVGLAMGLSLHTTSVGAQQVATDGRDASERPSRRVTVSFDNALVRTVIDAIAMQAGLRPSYVTTIIPSEARVTVRGKDIAVEDALQQALRGTGLVAQIQATGNLVIFAADAVSRSEKQQGGVLSGRVIDSTSRKGIPGVTLTVLGTKASTVSRADGSFRFTGIPAGTHQLSTKLLGYSSKTTSVQITAGENRAVTVVLHQTATMLSQVVTTATGQQERIKIGNDIAKIDVPEVLRNAPVSNMSELLTNRIPGVVVQKTSGAPGAPSVIRIRGISSISLNNDPIIIVDGVRVYSTVTGPTDGSPIPGGFTASALDGIDPNSVETVEVLRGPSASALYGTDAANGIIVITTKRGQSGPTRWRLSTQQGVNYLPDKYPVLYRLWGRNSNGVAIHCPTIGTLVPCVETDSIQSFQILNDDRTTLFGRGALQSYSFGVDGGSAAVQYAFTISNNSHIGYQKLPDADYDRIRQLTGNVPDWQARPNRLNQVNGTSRVSAQISRNADLALTSSVSRQIVQTTPLVNAIRVHFSNPDPLDSLITLKKVPNFREQGEARRTTARFALNGNWKPASRINMSADIGWDRTDRNDRTVLRRGDCFNCTTGFILGSTTPRDDNGRFNSLLGNDDVISANVRGSIALFNWKLVSGATTFGLNYTQTEQGDVSISAEDLRLGENSFLNAGFVASSGRTSEARVAGVYVDQRIGLLNNRFFTGFGLRTDAGSGIGTSARAPKFPKLDFSIPIITGENPRLSLSTLRVRTAFGHSGRQPDVTARIRTYQSTVSAVPNSATAIGVSSIGNTRIRPERSAEFEGGFDAGLWNDRLEVSMTGYRKMTTDMIISVQIPPSVHGGLAQQRNLGDVLNTGANASVNARLLDRAQIRWDLRGAIYAHRNRFVRFSKEMRPDDETSLVFSSGGAGGSRNVEGYPLNGTWRQPLLSYADVNQDGFLTGTELQYADSAVYVGAGTPNFDAAFGTTVGLLGGRVNLTASFNYQQGQLQLNELSALGVLYNRLANDTTISMYDRATLLSGVATVYAVSSLRWQELSMSLDVPRSITRRLRTGRISVAVQGKNIGLWTNYSGQDPNVRSRTSEYPGDIGQLPPERLWLLRVDVSR